MDTKGYWFRSQCLSVMLIVQMMALHIPEENRCLDILELIEHKDMLKYSFLYDTLKHFFVVLNDKYCACKPPFVLNYLCSLNLSFGLSSLTWLTPQFLLIKVLSCYH
jgi:hypothetical protein